MDTATQRLLFRILFLIASMLISLLEWKRWSMAEHYRRETGKLRGEANELKLLDTQ